MFVDEDDDTAGKEADEAALVTVLRTLRTFLPSGRTIISTSSLFVLLLEAADAEPVLVNEGFSSSLLLIAIELLDSLFVRTPLIAAWPHTTTRRTLFLSFPGCTLVLRINPPPRHFLKERPYNLCVEPTTMTGESRVNCE